uniref:Large ribosomal subunit protein uL4c n=1 Tax=Antithamnionella ternifolia TaxID=207919 RepID=A0A4D6WIH7_9FLOR|nr:ribosomal protein L4 [Antithamnionella ternifolia]
MTNIQKLTYSVIDITDSTKTQLHDVELKINDNIQKNMYIIHRTIQTQLSLNRLGNANTKTRSEIRGGGRKPWKQKGTGRARAGSIRSPLWRGGGVIFGPKTKEYASKINKKEKQLAIRILLHNKYSYTTVAQNLFNEISTPSTKKIIKILDNLGFNIKNKQKILIIVNDKTQPIYLSIRNLPNIDIISANNLNSLSLIKADKILLTIDALQTIETIYNGNSNR